ncbi:MAG TPA: hypothetical protein PK992_06535 [Planctomycetaceae bacterium]|nr:hypothetical protein [Planctomycetaceae bacterium]
MFNRHAIGVRAHADGVGVKLANLSFMLTRGIVGAVPRLTVVAGASGAACSEAGAPEQVFLGRLGMARRQRHLAQLSAALG